MKCNGRSERLAAVDLQHQDPGINVAGDALHAGELLALGPPTQLVPCVHPPPPPHPFVGVVF